MSDVRIIRVSNLELPIDKSEEQEDPKVAELVQRYQAGEQLTKEDLDFIVLARPKKPGGSPANGNCNVC
jgi:hypothetical protein